MKKDVIIHIKSLIDTNGERDKLDITTKGKMLEKDGSLFLTYKETDSNGYDGCSVLIRAEGEKRVSVSRSGDVRSQLLIESGRRNICSYELAGGTAYLGISGSTIKSKKLEGGQRELEISYELDINSELLSKNQMFIKIKEVAN